MDLIKLIQCTRNLMKAFLPGGSEYIILDVSFKVEDNLDEDGKELLPPTIIFNTDASQELNRMKIRLSNISKKEDKVSK